MFLHYIFLQIINERKQICFMRFMWFLVYQMCLLCFICILLCFIFHFIFISGDFFRVRLGRIQFYCSTCGKISCTMFILLLKRIHVVHALFTLLINLSIPPYLKTKFLCFPPTLSHEIIRAFVLSSLFIEVQWSHNILET